MTIYIEHVERILHDIKKVFDDLFYFLSDDKSKLAVKTISQFQDLDFLNNNKPIISNDEKTSSNNDQKLRLDYLYAKDASEYLHTTTRKIALYRKYRLLKYSKLGKNYVYRKVWLDDFMETWAGYDLSNEDNVRLAIRAKEWKTNHKIYK